MTDSNTRIYFIMGIVYDSDNNILDNMMYPGIRP